MFASRIKVNLVLMVESEWWNQQIAQVASALVSLLQFDLYSWIP